MTLWLKDVSLCHLLNIKTARFKGNPFVETNFRVTKRPKRCIHRTEARLDSKEKASKLIPLLEVELQLESSLSFLVKRTEHAQASYVHTFCSRWLMTSREVVWK